MSLLIQTRRRVSEHVEVTSVNRGLSEATGGRAERLGREAADAQPVTTSPPEPAACIRRHSLGAQRARVLCT